MGGLEESFEECDYVFMRPNSLPVLKCEVETSRPSFLELSEESIYMVPRSITSEKETTPVNEIYPMVDMSELHHAPEEAQLVREMVVPDRSTASWQNKTNFYRHSAEESGFHDKRVFMRNPQSSPDFNRKINKFSSPTEKRALIMKKKNFLRRSASSDTLDSYVNAVRSAEEKSYFDDQFDMNIKLKISGSSLATSCGETFTIKNANRRIEKKLSSLSSSGKSCEHEETVKTHIVECYYLEPTNRKKAPVIPPLPPYNPPTPPSMSQRRLPPTPVQGYLEFQTDNNDLNNKPKIRQTISSPGSKYYNVEPLPNSPHSTSKPNWIYDEKASRPFPPPLMSRSSEPCLQTPKSSKSKGVNLFGKNLLPKNNVFIKSLKAEKKLSGSNLLDKISPERPSPKLNKKIHPVADLIKKRRGTMSVPRVLSLSSIKLNEETNNSNQETDSGSLSSLEDICLSTTMNSEERNPNKPFLGTTKSMPESLGVITPSISKHSETACSYTDIYQSYSEANLSVTESQSYPENRISNQSFLHQQDKKPANEYRNIKSPYPTKISSEVFVYDNISTPSVESTTCQTALHQNESDISPTKTERSTQTERYRHPSQHSLDGAFAPSFQCTNLYSATFSPSNLFIKKEKETPPRPPPPSLKKIREARLRSVQSEAGCRDMNRETGNLASPNDFPSPKVQNQIKQQRQRLHSNAEMLSEEPPYHTIYDPREDFKGLGTNDIRGLHYRDYSVSTSSLTSSQSQQICVVPRYNYRSSVESTESDMSIRDGEETAIYEDIEFNIDHHNIPSWAAPHLLHRVQIGKN